MKPGWMANKEVLLSHLIRIVEDFIASDKIQIHPALAYQDDVKRRIIITLNMNKVVQHIWESIRFHNSESLVPVFDVDRPIRSTGDMRTWWTGRPNEPAKKSHINFCVYDSTWEASESFELDQNPKVEAWVKNDHLGFEVSYIFQGLVKKYWQDYIIRLNSGVYLVLEVKGKDAQVDKTKRRFLDEWIRAVNAHGCFGTWTWAVSRDTADVSGIIENV